MGDNKFIQSVSFEELNTSLNDFIERRIIGSKNFQALKNLNYKLISYFYYKIFKKICS